MSWKGTEPQSGHGKYFKQSVWPSPLNVCPENSARHTVPSWIVFVPNTKRIRKIGSEPWSGRDKYFERPVWHCPLTCWPGTGTRHIAASWIICVPKSEHYDDVTMSLMASQITSLTILYSTVYSGADQIKLQSSASLAFVRGIHRGPVNSPHKRPVTRKMFPFDDAIMASPTNRHGARQRTGCRSKEKCQTIERMVRLHCQHKI